MRERLRAMWHDPAVSLAAIGNALGLSVTVITNEAARLSLPARETIRAADAHLFNRSKHRPLPVRPLPEGARTLPLLPSEEAALRQRDDDKAPC